MNMFPISSNRLQLAFNESRTLLRKTDHTVDSGRREGTEGLDGLQGSIDQVEASGKCSSVPKSSKSLANCRTLPEHIGVGSIDQVGSQD